MAKNKNKSAKLANRAKQDGSRPLTGRAKITGDICLGYWVVVEDVNISSGRIENMHEAIALREAINSGELAPEDMHG